MTGVTRRMDHPCPNTVLGKGAAAIADAATRPIQDSAVLQGQVRPIKGLSHNGIQSCMEWRSPAAPADPQSAKRDEVVG